MKFSCVQENLRQGLSIVSHIANRSVNLPILENVLIKAEEGGLKLMTTNLEMAISCVIRGKVDEKGEFTVPSRLLSDYVSLLPKERVDAEQTGSHLSVSCSTFQTKLNGISSSEFPLVPTVESEQRFSVKVNALRKAIGQVIFAVAANESRPEISGVLFKFLPTEGGQQLVLAATDSYRLAERCVGVERADGAKIEEGLSVIVPSRAVAELVRILGVFKDAVDNPEKMEIIVADNQIMFRYNQVELVSRTIEGKYPDYRQLIPERFETEASIPKEDLIRAVKATSLFSKSGLNDIGMRFTAGSTVNVSANNPQTGEHSAEVGGEVSGKENSITVNFRYLLDGLNNIEAEKVRIQMIDGMSPCLLRQEGEDGSYLYIVMPIRQ
ncbi:MAG: DNA polymerase III subunit beta [bacterium]